MKDGLIVDQIQSIREKNNSPWMSLLLLALELDRDRAIVHVREIWKNDGAIHRLLGVLVGEEEPPAMSIEEWQRNTIPCLVSKECPNCGKKFDENSAKLMMTGKGMF